MGVSYCNAGKLNTVAGQIYRIALNVPPRGEIIRAQCVQTSGANTTFAFTFYNSAASCPPDPLDGNGFPAPPTPPTVVDPTLEYMGQIGTTRAASKAQDRFLLTDGTDGGWTPVGPYVNNDGGLSNAKGKLYMKFVAGGVATYSIFLTIKTYDE